MAIWLARMAIDRWRHAEGCAQGQGADAAPLALIAETAHGPRIEALNDAGLAAGVGPGTMLADARAVCPRLRVVPADPAGDAAFLERLAVWARRWGPLSAADAPDGVLVDVGGVAHLLGGEDALLADAAALLHARGLVARAAIAPTAGAAWALAHHGPDQAIVAADQDIFACLADLPVAALRLDADVVALLARLGLKRIGDLAGIGRDALRRRFRARRAPWRDPLLRLDQVLGRVAEPLLPVVVVPAPLARRRLPEPVRHRELLDRVVADLAGDMARALERRGEGARRIELDFWRVDGDVATRSLEFAVATRDPAHIVRLLAARLDDIDAGFGIELAHMRAPWVEPLAAGQDGFGGPAREGTSLAVCLDRLAVRLGAGAVRSPVLRASHLPERAQRWRPPLEAAPSFNLISSIPDRPLKILDRPESIAVLYATPDGYPRRFRWRGVLHDVARVAGPERIAPEWWRQRAGTRLRDYYRVEDAAGRRYWICRAGLASDGRGGPPAWFLHGLYA